MINLFENALKLFDFEESKKENNYVVDPILGAVFIIYRKFTESNENIFAYVKNAQDGLKVYEGLTGIIPKENILFLPGDDFVKAEYISESKEISSELIYSLYKIRKEKHLVVILTPAILYRFYPLKETFDDNFITLKVGKTIDLVELRERLAKLGYTKVSKIDQSLEYAVRGGVIDVFSLNYENPIRIELFDDEIESIRFFNIETQTSYKSVKEITIIPATLNLLTNNEKEKAREKIFDILKKDQELLGEKDEKLVSRVNEDVISIEENVFSNKYYKYYGFLQDQHGTFLDYLSDFSIVVVGKDEFEEDKKVLFKEADKFLFDLRCDSKTISHLSYYNEAAPSFKNYNNLYILKSFYEDKNDISIPLQRINFLDPKHQKFNFSIDFLIRNNYKVLFLLSDENHKNAVKTLLNERKIDYSVTKNGEFDEEKQITISKSDLRMSYEFLGKKTAVICGNDLFYEDSKPKAYTTRFKQGKIIESYEELEPGDYIVHEKYGIGKFNKIETIEVDGAQNDYIEIFYANNQKLYVPLYQFNLIRKYVSKEGTIPKLTNINGTSWEKTKFRIKQKIDGLAEKLLELYQERAEIPGFAFKKDDEIQIAFENDFEHEKTEGQKVALKEIKKDMEAPHPMDRLLCGDVGFGKTEIALEAAMKAILSGKQVLFLCPTTVLAAQHFRVVNERFANFKIKTALLTRACTNKEKKRIVEGAIKGEIDLIIGTHKAFSSDLKFKDLGLLIIDEEQRFGVLQKENIKEKYKNIDILTLSATPIPRTLQSGLIGLKKISRIETPPKERLPIQTYVVNYEIKLVKDLIEREIQRKSQVFYVINNIEALEKKRIELQELLPEVRIELINGRMDKEDVDEIMERFYLGEVDLLLATSIIENGIDVPNANLLIVEDADRFGLAQLYQMKGRVGRGNQIAYAYLMIKRESLGDEARKRLKAIQDFAELGSGYKIAERDLLIRGAGDILGSEQVGFICEVGFDLYMKILNDTLKKKKGEKIAENLVKVNYLKDLDAYIPDDFAKTEDKLEIYQKIQEITSLDALSTYKDTLNDRFGKLPNSVEQIFTKTMIDLYLKKEEYEELKEFKDRVDIILSSEFSDINSIGTTLFMALLPLGNSIKMSYRNKKLTISIKKEKNWVNILCNVLKIVTDIYNKEKKAKILEDEIR